MLNTARDAALIARLWFSDQLSGQGLSGGRAFDVARLGRHPCVGRGGRCVCCRLLTFSYCFASSFFSGERVEMLPGDGVEDENMGDF